MNSQTVIEAYIDDTVRLLPRRQRADVARELRSLFDEELEARARKSGLPADHTQAMAMVHGYGHPSRVAARYQQPWSIIDPADSTGFLRSALLGAAALVLLAAITTRHPSPPVAPDDLVQVGVLVWLGVLVIYFGLKGAINRRRSRSAKRTDPRAGDVGGEEREAGSARWQPRDRDAVSRLGVAIATPFIVASILLYAAPRWTVQTLSGGRINLSWWTGYTAEFQTYRLPLFLGLLIAMLGLWVLAAVRGRWSRLTRRIGVGLNLGAACLILIFTVDGNILMTSEADRLVRDILSLVGVVYLPCAFAMLYDEIGRLERPMVTRQA